MSYVDQSKKIHSTTNSNKLFPPYASLSENEDLEIAVAGLLVLG
jgi:hypothetical protein